MVLAAFSILAAPDAWVRPLAALAQQATAADARPRVLFDLHHGQTYFSPEAGKETAVQKKYVAIAESLGLELSVTADRLSPEKLAGYRTVVLVGPTEPLDAATIDALVAFVNAGGSLLLGIDEERRQNLERSRLNEVVRPFGLTFTADTPYIHNRGALARAGRVNPADRAIPYSGGRAVAGGTPFSFVLDVDGTPSPMAHAAWAETASGGRIVAMGDVMVVLLLGRAEGPRLGGGLVPGDTIYFGADSAVFMSEVLSWLTYRLR